MFKSMSILNSMQFVKKTMFSQFLHKQNVIVNCVFSLFIFFISIILIHMICLIFLHFVSILNINHEESKKGSKCSAEEGGCLLW